MNLTGSTFVADLQQAFRRSMTAGLKRRHSIGAVDVSGVERTLYLMTRDPALKYLVAPGYD